MAIFRMIYRAARLKYGKTMIANARVQTETSVRMGGVVRIIAKLIFSITRACSRWKSRNRRKRRPRQGRLRAISELAAAASGCRAERGVNDSDDFIECQLEVITIGRDIFRQRNRYLRYDSVRYRWLLLIS